MSAVFEEPRPYRVTAQEYLRMGEAAVFAPDARLELIEGEIITRAPIGSRHAGAMIALNRAFSGAVGKRALVSIQNPLIAGPRSVPQPDLALLKPRSDAYAASHPTTEDVLLVVEVADATLAFDIGTKIPLYARAGVVEAWVVDVQERNVRVFREPSATGFRTSFTVAANQKLTVAALPRLAIRWSDVFP